MSLQGILKHRNKIYGFCAVWILLFHVYVLTGQQVGILTNFVSCGNCGVDVFLFLSGFSLFLSFQRSIRTEGFIDYRSFYRRRFSRVVIPYLLIDIPYYLFKYTVEAPRNGLFSNVLHFFGDLSSISFWLRGTQTTWYVFAVLVLYLLFPFFYRSVIKGKAVLLVICLCVLAIWSERVPILRNSSIFWARIPIFVIGIIAGANIEKLTMDYWRKGFVSACISLSFLLLLLSMGLFSIRNLLQGHYVLLWLVYGLLCMPLLICFASLTSIAEKQRHSILSAIGTLFGWCGSFSLEIYLVQIAILHILRFFGVLSRVGAWAYIIVLLITIPVAYGIEQLSGLLSYERKRRA